MKLQIFHVFFLLANIQLSKLRVERKEEKKEKKIQLFISIQII